MIGIMLHKTGAISLFWTRRAQANLEGAQKHIFERELDIMWEDGNRANDRLLRRLPSSRPTLEED